MNKIRCLTIMVFTCFILVNSIISATATPTATATKLSIKKTVSPSIIYLNGSGVDPEHSTARIDIKGFGITSSHVPLDTVYVLDSSTSMSTNDPSGERKEAAKNFTTMLDPILDQAGLVSWDADVDFTVSLTHDFTLLRTKIDLVDEYGASNLDVGLLKGINLLDQNTRIALSDEFVILMSDGDGPYTYSGQPSSPADLAASKGYRVYSIGVGAITSDEAKLFDMANATGGKYYSTPNLTNVQDIFSDVYQGIQVFQSPSNVNITETTQDYIIEEGTFYPLPDNVTQNPDGTTTIVWNDVGSKVGNLDGYLEDTETFTARFNFKCNTPGLKLPVQVQDESLVTYKDPLGTPVVMKIPQDYIHVSDGRQVVFSCDMSGNERNQFSHEDVYVRTPAIGATVTLYVVKTKLTWLDGEPLVDVSGGAEQIFMDPGPDLIIKIASGQTLGTGEKWGLKTYDIVVDVNNNGVYDEGIDLADSRDFGFHVVGFSFLPIPEVAFGTIATLASFFALALYKLKRH